MIKHTMKLLPLYFDYIKYGTKRIEIRLNDEKRQNLKVNDILIFKKEDKNPEYLTTEIKNLYKFTTIEELIDNFDISLLVDQNTKKEELINIVNEIYPPDKQNKYGFLAIEIEPINNKLDTI